MGALQKQILSVLLNLVSVQIQHKGLPFWCGRDFGVGVEAIELGPKWEEEVLSIISVKDEVESIAERRRKAHERLRRLGRAYVDGVYDD